MSDPLGDLAARAAGEPYFLASLLAAYSRSEGLDDAGLAAALGCPPEQLTMIRLCRAPRAEPHEFWEDVTRVAERFGADPQRLAEAAQRGRVVLRFRAAEAPAEPGRLMAARDAEGEPPAGPPPAAPKEAP